MRVGICLILWAVSLAAAAETFKWVDEDGTVHYSDRPHPGAEAIELREAQTFSAPAVRPAPSEQATEAVEPAPFEYDQLAITRPVGDETLWNVEGRVEVGFSLQPRLRSGHGIRVYLNGQRLENLPTTSSTMVLSDVVRGTHTLQAVVEDGEGQVLSRSEPVVFHVRQTSVLSPSRR